MNFGLAKEFGGPCHLRFDDTNPATEDVEYVDAIQEDIRWLGFDWGQHLYFASDYYQYLYDCAERLIQLGLAYVCDLTTDDFKEYRGVPTQPGRPSPWRDRPAAESLDLFRRMKAGEFADGQYVLPRKLMASPNLLHARPCHLPHPPLVTSPYRRHLVHLPHMISRTVYRTPTKPSPTPSALWNLKSTARFTIGF